MHMYIHTHDPSAPVLVDDENGEELGAVVLRRPAVPQELHLGWCLVVGGWRGGWGLCVEKGVCVFVGVVYFGLMENLDVWVG